MLTLNTKMYFEIFAFYTLACDTPKRLVQLYFMNVKQQCMQESLNLVIRSYLQKKINTMISK